MANTSSSMRPGDMPGAAAGGSRSDIPGSFSGDYADYNDEDDATVAGRRPHTVSGINSSAVDRDAAGTGTQNPPAPSQPSGFFAGMRSVFGLPTWMYYFFWAFTWLLGFGLLAFATDSFGRTALWGYILYIICIAVSVVFAVIIGYGTSQPRSGTPSDALSRHILHGSRIWALTWGVAFFVCELAFNTVAAQYNFNASGMGIINCILASALVGIMYLSGSAIFGDTPMFVVGIALLVESLVIPAFRVPRGYWITAVISGAALLIAGITDYLGQSRRIRKSGPATGDNRSSRSRQPSAARRKGLFSRLSRKSRKDGEDRNASDSIQHSTNGKDPSGLAAAPSSRASSRTSSWD